jgi:hypothetical protein
MNGVIRSRHDERQFIFIDSEAGSIFGHFSDCMQPAAHICLFQPGLPVRFDLAMKNGREYATNLTLECPVELEEYETSTISRWCKTFGFVRRNVCQCELFISGRELGTYEGFPGMQIRHKVAARIGKKRREEFFAVDVTIMFAGM